MRGESIPRAVPVAGAVLLVVAVILGVAQIDPSGASTFYALATVLCALAAVAYLVWYVEPVYILCAAVLLAPISGHWEQLSIPGFAAPDRLLLLATIAAVAIRAPGASDRPALRVEPVHWIMLAAVAYAAISALVVGTLFERPPFFKLLEAFGILPFLIFLLAPLIFRTPRERDILLRTFVALGLYLGVTTLAERLKIDALVFPKYILDPNVGTHAGRGRGPFVEAVTNGYAQYVCAVACVIGFALWRDAKPLLARFSLGVGALALGGAFLSQQRSVWLGAFVATVIAATAIGEARRHAPAILSMLAIVVGGSLVLIPGFAAQVQERGNNQETVWDRKNLARASVNMVEERPLLGFGWDQFTRQGRDYFELADDYPLGRNIANVRIHSVALTYAADLGLIGLLLWSVALIAGVGGALTTRGPPDLVAWRAGLLAVAVCFVIVSNFVPPSVFPSFTLWLWAAVAWSGRYASTAEAAPARGPGGSARSPRASARPA